MYDNITMFIFTLLIVFIINFFGQRLIVNNSKVFELKTISVLIVQSVMITIILNFI
ncbi:hypothetical protein GCM10007111_43400 [Virgibacillus kapii]|uniref:Uncharacterized protein n=1 Tax=Virgibacillus kapii TaxID=1638645 RepID=A0ABQ2DYL3_9BACI|nr:hypothetical protein GCM10007111_43400 [Virgibacillus kapii]